ncbi:branched-chain amino acid ABC transporter permease [Bacillus sp. V5-8f]|uniref:branched-chain amino acid ABC transporter permease n=1 Tax=Bacillus sp. V5-8f TaxID=2053044 RepID=UPI000C77A7A3|nr:branched-chain amino acid ABC transporter permease [Bacillus sp. V5-8f]PLT33491.1 branched-chain amino acid ABC transporter permease [Bacillus sp. V5-8f]
MILQTLVSGLTIGCIYGLAALGLVLIYKTTDVVNFAQGEMAMFTTFISYIFLNSYGLPYYLSFILSLLFAAVLGIVAHQGIMRPVQKASLLNQIVLTLALYMFLRGVAGILWGHIPVGYPEALPGEPFQLGQVFIKPNELFVLGVSLLLMVVFYVIFHYTKIGLAMRAASQDVSTSQLMGVRVLGIFTWAWAIGTVLGGVAGMLIAPITYLDPNMMQEVSILAFAAAVLGGFVSLPGAVLGGLFIGIFETIVATYISTELKTPLVFLLIILILYVRPNGLFGVEYTRKV